MIPVRNLYVMLSYAWDRLEEADALSVGIDEQTELKDLLASVLLNGVRRCLREGIDRGYVEERVDVAGIRGKFALSESVRSLTFLKGLTRCDVDAFTEDILANQLIKTTLWRISKADGLNPELVRGLNDALRRMPAVSLLTRVTRSDFQSTPVHGNNRIYRFLLSICQLIFDSALTEKGDGGYLFKDFIQDDHKMRRLFQQFVSNFLKHHQDIYKVKVDKFGWSTIGMNDEANALLPMMETDITLKSENKVIVIDTKFSKDVLQARFSKQSLRSEHLYQLFSYLKNLETRGYPYSMAEGILLYPTVHTKVDTTFHVQGHSISVRTIDLTLPTSELKQELLKLTLGDEAAKFL